MPIDPASLMGELRQLFSGLYAAASSDQAFLAFETLGMPLSDEMFKLDPADSGFSQPVAVECLSNMANQAPRVVGGSLSRGMNTVDGTISLFLKASMPANADAMVPLGAVKNDAQSQLDADRLGSMSGVPDERFHPVYASPPDWYVPPAGGAWATYGSGQQQGTTPPPPAPREGPPIWHVLPLATQPTLDLPVNMGHPLLAMPMAERVSPAVAVETHPQVMERTDAPMAERVGPAVAVETRQQVMERTDTRWAPAAERRTSATSATSAMPEASTAALSVAATAQPSPPPRFTPMMRSMALTRSVAALGTTTTPQPVATDSIDVSFEYRVVTLGRPWFPDTFLMLRNWYVPGYALGDFSHGTGGGDTGLMPVLTTGFVAVRNLSIVAKWSAPDLAAVQGSASFGPFSLIGRGFDAASGTLTCSGMQIIGWFCSALPVLPPVADPSLPAPPPPDPAPAAAASS